MCQFKLIQKLNNSTQWLGEKYLPSESFENVDTCYKNKGLEKLI